MWAELRRGILRGLVLALLVMLGGCIASMLGCARYIVAVPAPQPAPPADPAPLIRDVALDSVSAGFLDMMRERSHGHADYADRENVLCLYGVVRGDTAIITFLRPTKQYDTSGSFTRFDPCVQLNAKYFGQVRYLGTAHNHNGGVDCGFSVWDNGSFKSDPHALIEVVTCSQGSIWRAKYRASPAAGKGKGSPTFFR